MARYAGLILLLAGVLVMTARAAPATTTAASMSKTAHYGGPDVAFSLDYPTIWKLETNGPNVIRLRPQPGTEDKTYHMFITVVERTLAPKESLKTLVDHDKEDMSDRWSGLKILADKETKVGNVDGWVCDYEYPRTGGVIWKVIRYIVVEGKCAYSFTVNEQKLDAERAGPDVRAVLESFRTNSTYAPSATQRIQNAETDSRLIRNFTYHASEKWVDRSERPTGEVVLELDSPASKGNFKPRLMMCGDAHTVPSRSLKDMHGAMMGIAMTKVKDATLEKEQIVKLGGEEANSFMVRGTLDNHAAKVCFFYALHHGHVEVVTFSARAEDYDDVAQEAQKVIDTLEWIQ